MSARPDERGFTLLELVVVVCIVALLAVLLVSRVRTLQAAAERASMEHVLGAIRSATAIEIARHVARGNPEALVELVGTNPMELLAEPPANYLGRLEGVDAARAPGGHWYWDGQREMLVYRVRYTRWFRTGIAGPARARFKFSPVWADVAGGGARSPPGRGLRGLRVAAVEPYRWLDPGAEEAQEAP
jgi:general secretion pathway protein G